MNSNNVQVWDREIILTALADYYEKYLDSLQEDIVGNITDVSSLLTSL